MEWLNYHHLFYFWKVVRLGSITAACKELRLAPPTISAQLRSLDGKPIRRGTLGPFLLPPTVSFLGAVPDDGSAIQIAEENLVH